MPPTDALLDSRPTHLTTFTVKVDGEALPATYRIVAVDIVRAVNRIPAATLVLHDGDVARQDFEISAGALLVPGKQIEILGGYAGEETPLFNGVVTQQRIRVRRRGGSRLHVEARDAAFRMALDRKSRYFAELTDSQLLEDVIRRYPDLTPQVAETTATHPEIVQYQVSDWDFVVDRAEKLGMLCILEDGTFRVAKPDPLQEAVLTLSYGEGVFDLDMELDARSQYGAVSSSAWDPATQEMIDEETDDVTTPGPGDLSGQDLARVGGVETYALRHTGALKPEELGAWAEALMTKARFSRIRGTIRFQGNEGVGPGDLVTLEGLGERFNGVALVTGVRHAMGEGDWETTVQVGLDPQWHHERFRSSPAPAAGFHPAIHGLQIGVVTALEDPDGEDRVQVRLPVIGPDDVGTWARLATLDAGEGRGTVFRPEIGDEVVVGFLTGDPEEAIVLGTLHSSARPAPIDASDDNHVKGLVTRSEMKVLFDDEAPSVTIETPNGNRIVVSDGDGQIVVTDESGSTLTMDSDGVTIESPADIVLKATGDLSLEGTNVTLEASASLTAEGSAGATLKSGGATEVKGSVVKLN